MRDLDRADLDRVLADITAIRSQVAAGTAFQGYGPTALAATGALALAATVAQAALLDDPTGRPLTFLAGWIAVAIVSIGAEMLARSRRHHSGLADAMILNAVEAFLPAGAAGALLLLVLARLAPESLWLLPGLWQVLVGLGLFASLRALPRPVALAAGWYVVAGLGTIAASVEGHALSPWTMGLPFALGQGLLALILHRAPGGDHE
ncbi:MULTISPECIES: hypothetical protein [Methylobacterium]|uniref:hypothetical protein n=1 Tax=Methylobacterium TaxID=407 RepID=UPI0008EC2464|nr:MULTISPECIES: hypothetical protein [Methylobacterium]MBZ6415895.1 hypothetical protein [Methylobacterium sp.]MBK3397551.1 hypothetical protein [Methylobacterium ajmalii]MBK3411582.1 hypothetical protein [Methylobacterium ajmalii]MBK3421820.1 hypothetical protein [Methylobacterium ajmalii]SFF48591.1 hypothetical protein SAMN04487844_12215 [Methylobacterium sp. yr596]